ncbi:hypothetical protein GCM10009839_30390 [Catenulispora yoronensis]|uniref:Uncharacterized protein n=1 Tax=Catenulispora yoronensis TaxID=450799 RepID=A0ABP5FN54_9ACTN
MSQTSDRVADQMSDAPLNGVLPTTATPVADAATAVAKAASRVGNKTALLVIACVAQFMVVLDRSK